MIGEPTASPGPDTKPARETSPEAETRPEAATKLATETKPPVAPNGTSVDAEPTTETVSATDTEPTTDTVPATDAGTVTDAEPAEEKADPWLAFAPAPERVPTRLRRWAAATGRVLIHEWTLAIAGALVLAVVMTWPTLRYPLHTIPQDVWDPSLQAWQMAWSGHILLTDPGQLWHANAFFPEGHSFAFSDTLLGYAPIGMIGAGPAAAIFRYNIMYVLLHAFAFFGAYALVRQLGSGRAGAAVAGAAFAYAPWRLSQAGHMHVLSTGGIALALAMLARGHGWSLRHGYRPERTNAGWTVAGWLVATWQISLGFGIGLPFAYLLGLIVIWTALVWLVRRVARRPRLRFRVRMLVSDVIGMLVFGVSGLLLALQYLTVADQHPEARRTVDDLKMFSPPLKGFFIAPAESWIWGSGHADARAALHWPAEMTMLPGFVLYGLAAAGLVFSIWTVRQRILLLVGVAVSIALAMGTQFFDGKAGYLLLFRHLPGWEGLRTPGRLVLWTTLLLGILAAGAVSAFGSRAKELSADWVPARPGVWLRLATLVPLVLVLVEGLNTTPHPIVPEQPAALRTVAGPLMVLPSNALIDENVMLWATDKFQPMVNGGSGFIPVGQDEIRQKSQSFPDEESVISLRELGVRTVVVLRDRVAGTPWEHAADAQVDGLGIGREVIGDAVVFHLNQ